MSAKRLLLGTVILGVVMNLLDVLLHGFALASINPTIEGARMEDWMMPWFIVGDFISALMLTWFYGIVRGSFSSGWKFGAVTALVFSFPYQLMNGMMIKGFPYWLSWVFIAVMVIEWGIFGCILDRLFQRKTA